MKKYTAVIIIAILLIAICIFFGIRYVKNADRIMDEATNALAGSVSNPDYTINSADLSDEDAVPTASPDTQETEDEEDFFDEPIFVFSDTNSTEDAVYEDDESNTQYSQHNNPINLPMIEG